MLLALTGRGQNLVPNPGFEDTLPNPTWSGTIISDCLYWNLFPVLSPDHYHNLNPGCPNCASNLYQVPHTGDAYAGAYTYHTQQSNLREYIQVQLLDTLEAGKQYCISFYISRNELTNYSCDNIGAYFSPVPAPLTGTWVGATPQVKNDTLTNSLRNDTGWVLVSGTFIASGNELFIAIGNFEDDSNSDIYYIGGGQQGWDWAYYYIDDISVVRCEDTIPDSVPAEIIPPNVFTPNGDGINDLFEIKTSGIENYHCLIFDRWGVKVFETTNAGNYWDGRTTSGMPCPDGTYYYLIEATGTDTKTIIKKGFVQVIR